MSLNIEGFIRKKLQNGIRVDGRKFDDYRPVTIEYGVSAKSAEGSARVKIGDTEVVAGVKLAIDKPYADRPEEGSIMVNAELLPLSSPEFEAGPPGIDSIELSRVVDRGIRESKAIDFKKLCIIPGEKIWMIFIDIYPINDDGNLFDAASLAAMAALKDAVYPVYDEKTNLVTYEKTNKKLPVEKTPISITLFKIGDKILIDPNTDEEAEADARLTVASVDEKTICALQKGGQSSLTVAEVNDMVALALKKRSVLAKALEAKK